MQQKFLIVLLLFIGFIGCKKDDVVPAPPSSNLTISILSLNRNIQNGVEINWKADREKDVQLYQLERSTDSTNFSAFSDVTATANNDGSVTYTHNDGTQITANTFYRIKGTVANGVVKYSNIIKIGCDLKSSNIIGRYKISALRYRPDASSAEIDILASLDPCDRDNYIFFNSNNTNTFQDVGIQCVPPNNSTGTWSFMTPNMLHLDGDVYTVTSFGCSGITFTFDGTSPGELTTIVLTRQ